MKMLIWRQEMIDEQEKAISNAKAPQISSSITPEGEEAVTGKGTVVIEKEMKEY